MSSQIDNECFYPSSNEWRDIFRASRFATLILILSVFITIVLFLPYARLTSTERSSVVIVRANGETYHTEIKYALEIISIRGLHDLWSRIMFAGYAALYLSPCAVLVYSVISSFRQLKLLQGSKAPNRIFWRDIVWSQAIRIVHALRLWLSALLGLIPSLILTGIYLSGVIFEIHQIRSLIIYDFELLRILLILGVLFVGWWGTNILAITLGTLLVITIKEPIVVFFGSIFTTFFLLIGSYISTIPIFNAASPLPVSGAREFSVTEITPIPLAVCLISPIALTAILLFISGFVIHSFSETGIEIMEEI